MLKRIKNKIINYLIILNNKGIVKINDRFYIKFYYKYRTGKKLNLKNPLTFNEKLQWLKLYDRKDIYTKMVDKYEAKNYVSNIIGEEYIIPTLGVWDKFDDIDFDKLPNKFVLKCTHDSGGLVICKDKNKLDIKETKHKINASLKTNFFYHAREWPYKNVKPRIIAEKYMENINHKGLIDYKFFCFNGVFKILLICSNRFFGLEKTWFDRNFELMDLEEGGHPRNKNLSKPQRYNEMIKFAEKLSKNIPFLRVDFYEIDGHVYFGEMTFYPSSGYENFTPDEYNNILGEMIQLPKK